MQLVSGQWAGRLCISRPDSDLVANEVKGFFNWFNSDSSIDLVLKAAISHLWFVTIYPFDDGNGRIARAITDMQLARTDKSTQRFYSMFAQIKKESINYYHILESTQKGTLDIT